MSGLKYDEGKAPMSMLDWKALEQVAKVLDYGAKKYTQNEVCTCGAMNAEKKQRPQEKPGARPATSAGSTTLTRPSAPAKSETQLTGTPPIPKPVDGSGENSSRSVQPGRETYCGTPSSPPINTGYLLTSCSTFTGRAASTVGPTVDSSWPRYADTPILDSGAEHASWCGSGRSNWRKGMLWSRLADAALRHLLKWVSGSRVDEETGLSHLAHAMCCLMFLLNYEQTGLGEDDV